MTPSTEIPYTTARLSQAWVFRVGFNLAASWGRRQSAEWRANRRSRAGSTTADAHLDADAAEVFALRSAVASLPARQRAVVVARYYFGYDVAGTAALLGIAPDADRAAGGPIGTAELTASPWILTAIGGDVDRAPRRHGAG